MPVKKMWLGADFSDIEGWKWESHRQRFQGNIFESHFKCQMSFHFFIQ